MNRWAYLLVAAAAVGAAVAAVVVAAGKARARAQLDEIPVVLQDCLERIEDIQREIDRWKPDPTA